MDPITHAIAGSVISRLWFKKKWAMHILVFSALLSDMDFLSYLFSPEAMVFYRRGITHSIAFMLSAPVLISLIASKTNGGRAPLKKHFNAYYLIALIGIGSHIFLDILTPYGVRLFAPLDERYYSFSSVYVLDPVMAVILFTGFMVSRKRRKYAKKALAIALVFCMFYLGVRTAVRQATFSFARTRLHNNIIASISPMPLSLWQWWYVAQLSDGRKQTGVVDIFAGNVYKSAIYPVNSRSPLAARAARTELATGFLKVFPSAHIEAFVNNNGHTEVTFRALSYAFSREPGMLVMVYLNSSGKVVKRRAIY